MPEILLISDSHGLTEEITEIKERHSLENMIHCGDSELDYDNQILAGFVKVKGNCDFDNRYSNEQKIVIEDLGLFITHGHLYNVKSNILSLSYRAEEENAQVICFGHTHIAGAWKVGKQLFINPGSIRAPRNRVEKTYAILEWDNLLSIQVKFYTVNGNVVEEMTFNTSLKD